MKRSKQKKQQKKGQNPKNNGSPKKNSTVAKSSNKRTPIRSPSRKGLRSNNGTPNSRKITEFFSPSEKHSSEARNYVLSGSPSRCKRRLVNETCETTVGYKEDSDTSRNLPETTSNISQESKVTTRSSPRKCPVNKVISKNNQANSISVRSKKMNISGEYDMDIPSYQEILKEKRNCDKYMREIQELADMVQPIREETSLESGSSDNTPKKLFQLRRYNTRSSIKLQPSSSEFKVCEEAKSKNCKMSLLPSHEEQPENVLKCKKLLKPKNTESSQQNKENVVDVQANLGTDKRRKNKNHSKCKEDAKPKKFERKSSGSYDKYGICMPSHQDMLNQKQYCDNYSDVVQNLMDLVVPLPQIQINPLTNQKCEVEALNCKAIAREELIAAYKSNINYLEDIIDGKIPNERHEKFKRVATREELTFNISMIAFTNEQKQMLVKKLCKRFGNSSLHSDYYFKVLLPELCLKIFMDMHSMSREEATEYLECYPVDM